MRHIVSQDVRARQGWAAFDPHDDLAPFLLRRPCWNSQSPPAVKTRIWIVLSVYVLLAIVRKRLGLEASLYPFLQIPSVTLFEKTLILGALQLSAPRENLLDDPNRLILFGF